MPIPESDISVSREGEVDWSIHELCHCEPQREPFLVEHGDEIMLRSEWKGMK